MRVPVAISCRKKSSCFFPPAGRDIIEHLLHFLRVAAVALQFKITFFGGFMIRKLFFFVQQVSSALIIATPGVSSTSSSVSKPVLTQMETIQGINKRALHQLLLVMGCAFCLVLFHSTGFAQDQQQVARYATGKQGTKSYEHFSFWVRKNKPDEISYSYGEGGLESEKKLTHLGKCVVQGEACFKVQFPNALVLYIVPKGNLLKVVDGKGRYSKNFQWEYEGPVNGIGTFCSVCAEDDRAAMKLIKTHFMK
jgi:hypothetical protein